MALIELQKINKSFGDIDVIKDLDFKVEEGEMVAIIGKSGAGKTTLLNIIAGIEYQDSGRYLFDGGEVSIKNTGMGISFRKDRIGLIVQHFALINDFTVYDNVELGLWERKLSREQRKKKVFAALESVGISSLASNYPSTLSGGEKQRVAIARAIVGKHKVILADEPTGSLDSDTEKEILTILQELNKKGTTIVLITHDMDVANICDRIVTLNKN